MGYRWYTYLLAYLRTDVASSRLAWVDNTADGGGDGVYATA